MGWTTHGTPRCCWRFRTLRWCFLGWVHGPTVRLGRGRWLWWAPGGVLRRARVERWMFASRNRITTGLCPATVLVESPARGGSLISAASAVDQNRELYVFDPPSQGTRWSGNRNLLADGVGWAVRDENDLWRAMAGDAVRGAWRSPIPAACQPLWACLSAQSTHSLSGLARRLGWQEEVVRRRLNALDALGLVSRLPGRRYLRT